MREVTWKQNKMKYQIAAHSYCTELSEENQGGFWFIIPQQKEEKDTKDFSFNF